MAHHAAANRASNPAERACSRRVVHSVSGQNPGTISRMSSRASSTLPSGMVRITRAPLIVGRKLGLASFAKVHQLGSAILPAEAPEAGYENSKGPDDAAITTELLDQADVTTAARHACGFHRHNSQVLVKIIAADRQPEIAVIAERDNKIR